MDENVSPVGRSVREDAATRRAKSAAYREMEQRLAPLEQLARLVIMRRAALGISQQELAERVGTTASAISRLESGHHRINLDTLQRVAEGLNMRAVIGFEIESEGEERHELVTL
jgi:ribosome-binding protein aMBF1 (putative translation factor)